MSIYTVMLSDDTHIRTQLNKLLSELFFNPCDFFRTPEEFFEAEREYCAENTVVIIDDRFQYRQAMQICYRLQQRWPGIRIVMLLKKEGDIPDYPIENGSVVFLPKPLSAAGLEKALKLDRTKPESRTEGNRLVGNSEKIIKLRNDIRKLSAAFCNTLIIGETGAGKEVVVQELKQLTGKRIVSVNCSSLNSPLAESDLFGHHKGSFTGSTNERLGYIRRADGGILFLDEIETLSSQAQATLLRFLDSGEYNVVGGDILNMANVTVIAATNEPVDRLLAQGRLRKDFYMRISVALLRLPPLREHLQDIPLLVRHREEQLGYRTHIREMEAAYSHYWPGNVRELFNVVQRAHMDNPENPVITEELITG